MQVLITYFCSNAVSETCCYQGFIKKKRRKRELCKRQKQTAMHALKRVVVSWIMKSLSVVRNSGRYFVKTKTKNILCVTQPVKTIQRAGYQCLLISALHLYHTKLYLGLSKIYVFRKKSTVSKETISENSVCAARY